MEVRMTHAPRLEFMASRRPEEGGYPGFRPSRTEVDGMLVERDAAVPMRDGTIIYVDVFRPASVTRQVPVLISYGPFGKHRGFTAHLAAGADLEEPLPDGTPFEAPVASYWVAHDYAVIYADPRGCWGSEGDATYFSTQESQDGYDLVEWAGTQGWSNGKVGLSGVSYLAITQYAIAAQRPPHLAAINPSEGISDNYRESIFQGGIPETQFAGNFANLFGFGLGRREDLMTEVFSHPFRDEFWAAKAPELERIDVPAFFVCSVGNHGLHTRGTFEAYRRASSTHKWLDVHGRREWRYYYSRDGVERQRAFFDHFLHGRDTEIASWPPVRVEYRDRTETGPILSETQWPPKGVEQTALHLDAASATLQPVALPQTGTCSYDPLRSPTAPILQAGDEKAVFSHTFAADTYIAGNCVLRLYADSPGAIDMDVFVELDKIDRDGLPVPYPFCGSLGDGPLAQGWLRASRRELDASLSTPDRPVHAHRRDLPLPDGGPIELVIEIWPFTAYFHASETLRLTIAGADIHRWPREDFVSGHDFTNNTAPHVLYTGGKWDSALYVPIVGNADTGSKEAPR
jgi:uncharacterized protein